MPGRDSIWHQVSERNNAHGIPTQPKYPWSSSKENETLHMLDKDIQQYRAQAELFDFGKLMSKNVDSKPKNKFGSFMGKLLLKSNNKVNKPVAIVQKEKMMKQQTLTEEPFADLFRMRKNRRDQSTHSGTGISNKMIAFALKPIGGTPPISLQAHLHANNIDSSVVCHEDPTLDKSPHNQVEHKLPQSPTQKDVHPLECDNSIDLITKIVENSQDQCEEADDDDLSSIDSLQSDDDVLGPWIELGILDSMEIDKFNLSLKESPPQECPSCTHNSLDRDPLALLTACSDCVIEWSSIFTKLSEKINVHHPEATKKVQVSNKRTRKILCESVKKNNVIQVKAKCSPRTQNMNPLGTEKRKQSTSIKKTRKLSKAIFPPTKTKHSQRTNQNMMATRKNETSGKKSGSTHYTTGAFMTRKTATSLADPNHGFHPNPYGFSYNQIVEVLNVNGYWYQGTLDMMKDAKVRVKYNDWDDQEEWIIMGSRRLRTISPEIEQSIKDRAKNNFLNEGVEVAKDSDLATGETDRSPLTTAPFNLYSIKPKQTDNDYVSSTMDKDPTQIFNNNEVFMTRSMARTLVDEHGFKPNSFGYRRNRAVAITFFSKSAAKRKEKQECIGYLREMRSEQIRVWYPELHQSEWFPIGSRRVRILTEEENSIISNNSAVDFTVQEVPPVIEARSDSAKELLLSKSTTFQDANTSKSVAIVGRETPNIKTNKKTKSKERSIELEVQDCYDVNANTDLQLEESANSSTTASQPEAQLITNKVQEVTEFLTTGAFATRRAMRQLKDENGFTPNPYGYTNNLAVEVLNTRSGKTKFWECGKLIAMRPGQVRVHYEGWADIYDEWIMVGSRRIRIAEESSKDAIALPTNSGPKQRSGRSARMNDLLITEANPEVKEDAKKNRKHQLVKPQDYQELGMLVNLEELAIKEAKRNEARKQLKISTLQQRDEHHVQSDDEDTSYKGRNHVSSKSSRDRSRKSSKQKVLSVVSKKNTSGLPENGCDSSSCTLPTEKVGTKQIFSLRLAHVQAAKDFRFVANVYGYDYMQHVTVLHNDKKVYEGRLVSLHKNKVKVHYCGWLDKFDEEITLGSRRIQIIENDHEVVCMEPNYKERYEEILLKQSQEPTDIVSESEANAAASQGLINRFSRKRLTLNDVEGENNEHGNAESEYHRDEAQEGEEIVDIETWKVYCNQCNIVIKQFRYYCTYCENPAQAQDYRSFELCLGCFDQNFPFWHNHPRSSFAIQSVIDSEIGPRPIKGELVTVWEEDILEEIEAECTNNAIDGQRKDELIEPTVKDKITSTDDSIDAVISNIEPSMRLTHNESTVSPIALDNEIVVNELSCAHTTKSTEDEQVAINASKVFSGAAPIESDQGYKYLKRWRRRKVCAFCNDDDDTSKELGRFIGPFMIATFNKNGVEKKRSFWAHHSCARYSPEVFCTPEGKWYNVTLALRRGRGMRCHGCKEKGATIGCFESKCNKSFHLPCSQKPVSYYESGVIFWCSVHEAYYNKKDTYVNVFNCDGCSKELVEESWFTCVPCASRYFSSFDLCSECYEKFPAEHAHNEDDFEETSFAIIKEMEAQKATERAREKEETRAANAKKKKKPLFPRRRKKLADGSTPVSCCYCGTYEAEYWRKGYDGGVLMCNPCFELALFIDNDGKPSEEELPLVIDNAALASDGNQQKYLAPIEDYSHKPYFTRDTLSAHKFSDASTGQRLTSYEPQPNQLFSLTFDSTYFDIPGRAPRWATHSGTDYHGTWLPQTVRRAILKYTRKEERVLSNFLGRGTDAIECFLLQRRCCGVDINPAAVSLSQRNCCFEIPPGLTSAEYRPIIAQADSRKLSGALFADESFHHILSHPPYKDCVAYSTHLDGDLSRFTSVEDFKSEYAKVVAESWRLLKMDRRITLGIGDNREHCFYVPVGFHLMRLYLDQGFELEELIIKRQRYCSAFGLGTYLCVQYDFLVFTHEFIATFRKVADTDRMIFKDTEEGLGKLKSTSMIRGVPSSAITRKSVVMGTVWVFKPTETHSFDKLCVSRMVERFGKDDGNWEHIYLHLSQESMEPHPEDHAPHSDSAESQITICDDIEEEHNLLSNYEQERLRRIDENNKTLLKLGLISELSEESDDIIYYETLMSKKQYKGGDLVLMITEHRSDLLVNQIGDYRHTIVQLAMEAATKLSSKGMLIIGTQDIRDPYSGKLWPLSMLVLEDIERKIGRDVVKLKEMVVTVPEGYSKDRNNNFLEVLEVQEEKEDDFIDIETVNHEFLPIVHAVYLVFQKF